MSRTVDFSDTIISRMNIPYSLALTSSTFVMEKIIDESLDKIRTPKKLSLGKY